MLRLILICSFLSASFAQYDGIPKRRDHSTTLHKPNSPQLRYSNSQHDNPSPQLQHLNRLQLHPRHLNLQQHNSINSLKQPSLNHQHLNLQLHGSSPQLQNNNPQLQHLNPQLQNNNLQLQHSNSQQHGISPQLHSNNPQLHHLNPQLDHLGPQPKPTHYQYSSFGSQQSDSTESGSAASIGPFTRNPRVSYDSGLDDRPRDYEAEHRNFRYSEGEWGKRPRKRKEGPARHNALYREPRRNPRIVKYIADQNGFAVREDLVQPLKEFGRQESRRRVVTAAHPAMAQVVSSAIRVAAEGGRYRPKVFDLKLGKRRGA